ncbi:MAG: hypothetical protein GWP59_04025 [Chlamydiales bacterium]|nr:cytochrome c biogenesis protein CcsA [Chlamydiales bacterium]NCF70851.1 hypothetical protein [Chlamydiales bacterium]
MKKVLSLLFAFLSFACLLPTASELYHAKNNSLVSTIAQLPIQHEGRVKPFDSAARSFLALTASKSYLKHKEKKVYASDFFWNLINAPENIADIGFIRIDHPDILTLIKQSQSERKLFSLKELDPYKQDIRELSLQIQQQKPPSLSPYQRQIVELHETLFLCFSYMNSLKAADSQDMSKELNWPKALEKLPPSVEKSKTLEALKERYQFIENASLISWALNDTNSWHNFGSYMLGQLDQAKASPYFNLWASISSLSQSGEKFSAEKEAKNLLSLYKIEHPTLYQKAQFEFYFNLVDPFALLSYLFLLLFFYILLLQLLVEQDSSFKLALYSFSTFTLLYALAIVVRMFIENRPPVSDLHTSALFIGFCCTLLALLAYAKSRLRLFILIACLLAASSLKIAWYLRNPVDSFTPLRAVLDSNFWLSTHVVVITLGYSLTLLSSFIANGYLLLHSFSQNKLPSFKKISHNLYFLALFSLLTCTVGTVLGGVWADQSWGRFWGWDPKENGALMIVLWQALIIHAYKFRYIATRGILILSAYSSIITVWSWFGVNMLGVGLHSYGFIEEAFLVLVFFILIQLLIGVLARQVKPNNGQDIH